MRKGKEERIGWESKMTEVFVVYKGEKTVFTKVKRKTKSSQQSSELRWSEINSP